MKQLLLLIPLVVAAGCVDDRPVRARETVVVGEPVPVTEYYVVGGRNYYWHPRDSRWVEVREVPREGRAVRVERLPERGRR